MGHQRLLPSLPIRLRQALQQRKRNQPEGLDLRQRTRIRRLLKVRLHIFENEFNLKIKPELH